jgi:Ca-activated chloride channel family protein
MIEDVTFWLGLFHFIRPWWLIAVPLVVVLWWRARPKKHHQTALTQGFPPHLAQALTVGGHDKRRYYPIDGVAAFLVLMAMAAAGPTWSRLPNPLLAQTAPLAVALKVTPSMEGADIQPTRLERAQFKILDLVARRAGAETALIAYAGTAHRVAPLTTDPNILRSYMQGLSPKVMPKDGADAAAALSKAVTELNRTETPGAILFVLDDFAPGDEAAFASDANARPPVIFFVAAPDTVSLPQLDGIPNASVVRISADDSDLDRIERRVLSAYREALLDDETLTWDDKGWLLGWPAALLLLLWFRKGWTMRWAVLIPLVAGLNSAGAAHAEGWKDWFWTPDQQGRLAFDDKDFSTAAEQFQNPLWRAYAMFKDGQYEAAADAYATIDGADAAFGEGMARLRNREYRAGARAFEKALDLRPNFEDARHNLEVANAIVTLVEDTQAQSDTGEESGIGADETVFDNESGKGTETQIEAVEEGSGLQTADEWMRSVDTDVGDFLKSRFQIENTQVSE